MMVMRRRRSKLEHGWWPWALSGLIVVVLVLGFALFVMYSRPPAYQATTAIESWLNENGFDMFRPFRDNLPPGTVIRLERRGQSLEATADVTGLTAQVHTARSTDAAWKIDSDLKGLADFRLIPGLSTARLREAGVAKVVVSIDKVMIYEIPLASLSDAVKDNATLKKIGTWNDPLLVLVGAVLEAGLFHCEFLTNDNARLDLEAAIRSGKLDKSDFGASYHINSEGKLESTFPILLGYRAYDLRSQALNLSGSAPSVVPPNELEKRQSDVPLAALPPSQVTVSVTINVIRVDHIVEFKVESDEQGEQATGHLGVGLHEKTWHVGSAKQNIWFWWDTMNGEADIIIRVNGEVL
jgi:hypothetical protein